MSTTWDPAAYLTFADHRVDSSLFRHLKATGDVSFDAEGVSDTHRIAQGIRRTVGRWVADTYRRRPMIVPTVLAVGD